MSSPPQNDPAIAEQDSAKTLPIEEITIKFEALRTAINELANKGKRKGGTGKEVKPDPDEESEKDGETGIFPQLDKASKELTYMIRAFQKLQTFEGDISTSIKTLEKNVRDIQTDLEQSSIDHLNDNIKQLIERNLKVLRSNLTKVKILIPLQHQVPVAGSEERRNNLQTTVASKEDLPNPYEAKQIFESGSFVKEFLDRYEALNEYRQKLCLCFAIFPENAEVKKRLLKSWWIGERFREKKDSVNTNPTKKDRPKEKEDCVTYQKMEAFVDETLEQFVKMGFIEPVTKKGKLQPTIYKMHPIIRSLIIKLAVKEKFFNYDSKGNPTMKISASKKSCLIKTEQGTPSWFSKNFSQPESWDNQQKKNEPDEEDQQKQKGPENGEKQGQKQGTCSWFSKNFSECGKNQQPESSDRQQNKNNPGQEEQRDKSLGELETLFNISKQYPDLPVELFSKMRNIGVLYLGRWESTAERHIEVENAEFLDGLKNMKNLRFFSLQGISGISKLPKSLSKLTNLKILDLRACHNLEGLPREIGSLKSLTRLDLSECYLLDNISRRLSQLSNLKVLKGFVISQNSSCTLQNLAVLSKLEKLSVNVNSDKFDINEAGNHFFQLTELKKLKIAWGAGGEGEKSKRRNNGEKRVNGNRTAKSGDVLEKTLEELEKLDLQCFPEGDPPNWLVPQKLTNLKHLYIRGGILRKLGKSESSMAGTWKVETLRLKFLTDLKTNWKELQTQFPNLMHLEKVKCPQITFCPCDADGMWKSSKLEKLEL